MMTDDGDMRVGTRVQSGAVILVPEGDVDLSRSPVLRQKLREAQGSKPRKLIVDLALVEYMDSSGVATLVEALQIARKNSTKMVLCGLKDRVRSIFEIARLETVFTITASIEKAIEA